MNKILAFFALMAMSGGLLAQPAIPKELPQAFTGGNQVMVQFFKDSVQITPDIVAAKAGGLCIFKFTADAKGTISRIVACYADDYLLAQPVIDALKKSDGKWVIPGGFKFYDFILPLSINYVPAGKGNAEDEHAVYNFNQHRKPILATDQVPLNAATLLPTIVVNYVQ